MCMSVRREGRELTKYPVRSLSGKKMIVVSVSRRLEVSMSVAGWSGIASTEWMSRNEQNSHNLVHLVRSHLRIIIHVAHQRQKQNRQPRSLHNIQR